MHSITTTTGLTNTGSTPSDATELLALRLRSRCGGRGGADGGSIGRGTLGISPSPFASVPTDGGTGSLYSDRVDGVLSMRGAGTGGGSASLSPEENSAGKGKDDFPGEGFAASDTDEGVNTASSRAAEDGPLSRLRRSGAPRIAQARTGVGGTPMDAPVSSKNTSHPVFGGRRLQLGAGSYSSFPPVVKDSA